MDKDKLVQLFHGWDTNALQGDGHFTNLYVRAEDRMHAWKRLYQRLEAVKSRRMEKVYKKLREGRQKLISNNQRDLTYSSGMMMETEAEQEARSRKTLPFLGPPFPGNLYLFSIL